MGTRAWRVPFRVWVPPWQDRYLFFGDIQLHSTEGVRRRFSMSWLWSWRLYGTDKPSKWCCSWVLKMTRKIKKKLLQHTIGDWFSLFKGLLTRVCWPLPISFVCHCLHLDHPSSRGKVMVYRCVSLGRVLSGIVFTLPVTDIDFPEKKTSFLLLR